MCEQRGGGAAAGASPLCPPGAEDKRNGVGTHGSRPTGNNVTVDPVGAASPTPREETQNVTASLVGWTQFRGIRIATASVSTGFAMTGGFGKRKALSRSICHSEEPVRRLVTWESAVPGDERRGEYGLPRALRALAMTGEFGKRGAFSRSTRHSETSPQTGRGNPSAPAGDAGTPRPPPPPAAKSPLSFFRQL